MPLPPIPQDVPMATNLPEQPTGWACPLCQGDQMLFGRGGSFGYYCKQNQKEHLFTREGPEELMQADTRRSFGIRKLAMATPVKERVQEGWTKVELQFPPELISVLKTRFGDKLGSTITSVMRVMASSRTFVVANEDIVRMEEKLGHKVNGVAQLVGEVIALVDQKRQAETDLEEQRTKGGSSAGGVSVGEVRSGQVPMVSWFGLGIASSVAEKAKFNGISAEEWIVNTIVTALENNWA